MQGSLASDFFFPALFSAPSTCDSNLLPVSVWQAPGSQPGNLPCSLQAHTAFLTTVLTAKYIKTAKVWTSLPRTKWSSPRRSNVVKGLQVQDTQSCSSEKADQHIFGAVTVVMQGKLSPASLNPYDTVIKVNPSLTQATAVCSHLCSQTKDTLYSYSRYHLFYYQTLLLKALLPY